MRYKTKYALTGENQDSWAYEGPYVWADSVGDAAARAKDLLVDGGLHGERLGTFRIVSVEEIPHYQK